MDQHSNNEIEYNEILENYNVKCGPIYNTDNSDNKLLEYKRMHEYPKNILENAWLASILIKRTDGQHIHWCGAVLITSIHLLTAAHCLNGFPINTYLVRMGDHTTENFYELGISIWYIHEGFRKAQSMNNDIAIIVLNHPVKLSNHIQPICLPFPDSEYIPGMNCSIAGWQLKHNDNRSKLKIYEISYHYLYIYVKIIFFPTYNYSDNDLPLKFIYSKIYFCYISTVLLTLKYL